jgi:membrane protease YdiL (CAAX protease family)
MYRNKDVFMNETEFDDDSDYRKFAPELMAGESISEYPKFSEQRKIRAAYSKASLVMFLFYVGVQVLSFLMVNGITLIFKMVYDYKGWSLTSAELERLFESPTLLMSLNLTLFFTINVCTALIGCKIFKINVPKLFGKARITEDYPVLERQKPKKHIPIFVYIFAGFALQYITAVAANIVDSILESNGVQNYSPDIPVSTLPAILLSVLYGCIIAPITEEFLYRGFVLKAFSAVSQRTGIYVSAVFFAIGHQNISQALLAFALGLLLGYIAVKHKSIVPCIIVHMCVNSQVTVFYEILPRFVAADIVDLIISLFFYCVLFFGLASLIILIAKKDFPQVTRLQKRRNKLFLGSIAFWAVVAANVYETFAAIINNNIPPAG